MSRKVSGKNFRVILLILALLVSIYLFLHGSIFNIDSIIVQGNDKVSPEEIMALSGLVPGNNIFDIDADIACIAIQAHPMVKTAEVERRIPNKLEIKITERQVWAIIPYQEVFLCIDETGICFERLNKTPIIGYPIITMDSMPEYVNLGQAVNKQATDIIRQVWLAIPESGQQKISDYHYMNNENELKIYTRNGTEIRFGNMERLDEKAKTLTQVLQIESDFIKSGKDVLEYVDMRFKGEPVVKTRI
ncbi:MAG: FtsQ-type POTRA domain-containing protein [Syntrophomonas sp.]|nr:FtsQ-type POTRA domain-containing protein [Syntrophomonas sp.]